jgi:aldose 1-epimerase
LLPQLRECASSEPGDDLMPPPTVTLLGRTALPDGRDVERYRLEAGVLALEVMTLGAAVTALEVPDHAGRVENVVLAHERLETYAGGGRDYFGATVGRVANRIAGGRFELDGRQHQLVCNDGRNHLHGGIAGFDQQCWTAKAATSVAAATIEFERTSSAGEEGYPGELRIGVTYTLRPEGEVEIRYRATTDAPTIVSLTNHAYFNLRGAGRGDVLEHELIMATDAFLPVDESLIPTGEIRSVAGTPFDFRRCMQIGSRLASPDEQLRLARGYDHCMVLPAATAAAKPIRHACTLLDPASRRQLEVWTDQPGLQLYTGNFLDGSAIGPGGRALVRNGGVCLETEGFPDAPNHSRFPSVRLDPGETYSHTTVWRFAVAA